MNIQFQLCILSTMLRQSKSFLPSTRTPVRGFRNDWTLSADKGTNKVQAKTKTRKSKKKSAEKGKKQDDYFWYNSTDTIEWNETYFHCTVRGNPQPLRRHRTSRGFTYNPSASAQQSFRHQVQEQFHIEPTYVLDEKDNLVPVTHFGSDVALKLKVIFYLQRPLSHFVGSRRGSGRLRQNPEWRPSRRVDVDNLAKFVLDSLNGVLYGDDQQIVVLECTKCYDSQDDCLGKTKLKLQVITDISEDADILQD